MNIRIEHDTEHQRYELIVDDRPTGVAEYRRVAGATVFFHTEIERAHRGRGLGDVLVRGALEDTRANGGRVIPQCWFVAQYIEEHPEYQELLAA